MWKCVESSRVFRKPSECKQREISFLKSHPKYEVAKNNTGNKPGITSKRIKLIRINNDIELLDSPGILWPKLDEKNVAFNLASLTAIKEEVLPLYDVAEYILNTLLKYYPGILGKKI